MAQHKTRQALNAKTGRTTKVQPKKKKKQEEDKIVSKKQQSQERRQAAEKSGRAELKKTSNQHADERRTGAVRARNNSTTKKIGNVATGTVISPVKSYGYHTAKNATDAAGWASKAAYRAKENSARNKPHAPTKNDRKNDTQKAQATNFFKTQRDTKAKTQSADFKAKQKEYTKPFKETSKKLVEAQDKTLEKGAKALGLSDKKKFKVGKNKLLNKFVPEGTEFSEADIYKGTNKAVDELADYLIPYGGTTKASLKAAEGIMKIGKGGKALTTFGEGAAKGLSKGGKKLVREAVEDGLKNGDDIGKVLKNVSKQVAKSDFKQNVKKELIANAIQDATLGTTIDAIKGKQQGLKGDEFKKYMAENAVMNAAFGMPVSMIAGRTGKAGKNAIANEIANTANSANLSRAEGIRLTDLLGKEKAGNLNANEAGQLAELQRKAVGGATVNSKGKVVAKNADTAIESISREDAKAYIRLKAKQASGTLKPDEAGQFAQLQSKVDNAYKQTEKVSNDVIKLNPKEIKSKNLSDAETAVRFYERTGDAAKLKVAEKALESAKVATRNLNESLDKAVKVMTDKTGVEYKWVSGDDMRAMGLDEDSVVKGFTDFDKNGKATVIINKESPQAWQTVMGHETAHLIKKANAESFDSLGTALEKYAKDIGDYDELEQVMRNNYPEFDQKGEDFREEMVSEMLGRYVFGEDDKFIKKLAGESPTALQRIVDYIKNLIKRADNPELTEQFNKFVKSAEDAINEINPESIAKNAKDKSEKFSIVKKVVDENGVEHHNVVKLETNKFDNISNDKQRAKAFSDFVYDELAGKKFTAKDKNGKDITIEFARANETHKKDGAKYRQKTLDEIASKVSRNNYSKETQVAVQQADEMIEVAKYDRPSVSNMHGDLDANGWEYRTLTIMSPNGNLLDGVLNIAKTKDGRNILYDVKLKRKIGRAERTAQDGSPTANLSDNNIPKVDGSVNGKFSKDKPKKSLYNYTNEKRTSKIVEKANKLQDENDALIKTMTTSNNADEVAKAVTESDKVEAKLEALGSKPRRTVPEEPKEEPKPEAKTQTQKLANNKYASDQVKTALKDIEEAGVYKDEAEKYAKKFNDLDGKIGGVQNRLNNAKKKEYPTEAEKTAHIKELEDDLADLRNKQAKAAGEIEQLGKMKGADPNKSWREELTESQGTRYVNKEAKAPANLKNEDSWIKDKWNSVRRLWEDSLIDVENVAKKNVDKTLREEIRNSANRVRNSMHVANNWITKSRKTFDDKVGGKSLDEIFPKELINNEKKYKDFQEYLIMKHVPARHAKGTDIYPDISPQRADKIAKGLEKEYGKELTDWADDVYGYLKDLQQYRVDSGMLSKEAAEQFAKDYPFYVPTNRVNDEAISFFTGGTPNGIRTAKGGESQVLDMYSQIYTATNKTIHAAEENQMLNLYFKAKGITDEQIKQYKLDDLEHATINATVNKKSGDSKISFFIDGKPVEVPCSHQLALGIRELDGLEFERLMKAAKVATLYGKPFKALITDWNLVFGVRNGMRDIQQAVVNSKDSRYFGSSLGAAAHAITDADNPYRKLYSSMGGEQAQLVSYDAVAKNLGIEKQGKVDAIHEKVQDWVDASVPIKGKERHINPIHLVETINGGIEMMPRMCEFVGTIRKEADNILKQQGSSLKKLRKEIIAEVEADKSIGQTLKNGEIENRLAQKVVDMVGKDTIDSAMRNANDITLNFGRSGVLGRALNMGFVPYLNPSIQGLSKLVRLFTEAGGEGGWKALASLGMKIGAFNVSLAALNEIMLRDNEDYQNLNTRDKDNNFFIPYGEEGKFIKIPKPRENAVLIEPVEYGLRHFFDKTEYAYFDWDKLSMESEHLWDKIPLTDEGKQSFRTAIDNIGIINPLTSNMVSPLWQTFNNKTWYGGSIESAYETSEDENGKFNVPVKDRYDTGTSAIAIALGKTKGAQALNLSPKKIDNIMDSYLGMIYDLGISQTTEEARTRGNYLVRTVASQFIKDSVFSNKLSTKAWDKTDGMTEKQLQEYKGTYMYDTYKYDDAKDLITTDKNMTNEEKMAAKRALQIKKNKLNREAIDGTPNTSTPLKDIAEYLGVNKTLNKFLPDNGGDDDNWQSYYKSYKSTKGFKGMTPKKKEQEAQKFLDVYNLGVKGQKTVDPSKFHDSPSWGMTGVAAAELATKGKLSKKDATTIMESCSVFESQTKTYYNYAEHGGTVKRYAVTKKNNNGAEDLANELGVSTKGGSIWKNKYDNSKGIRGGVYSMSLATGKADYKDRAYYISAPDDKNILVKMNAGRGYAEKYGHTTEQLIKLGKKADKDGNTYLSNEEIEAACKTIKKGKATSEEMACAYVLLGGTPNKNPFGAIGDFRHDGDTGIQSLEESFGGKGGRGRGGRRRRGGGGGGSSKGTMPKTESGAIKGKVTDPFSGSPSKLTVTKVGGNSRTSNNITTARSTLNDAYRKKARKSRENIYKGK